MGINLLALWMTYLFGGGIWKKCLRVLMGSLKQVFQSCSVPMPRAACRIMSLKLSLELQVKVVYTDTAINQSKEVMTRKFLVMVPLGVLKKQSIGFLLELPKTTLTAISSLGMGLLNKVVMFWNNNNDIFWPKSIEWLGTIATSNGCEF